MTLRVDDTDRGLVGCLGRASAEGIGLQAARDDQKDHVAPLNQICHHLESECGSHSLSSPRFEPGGLVGRSSGCANTLFAYKALTNTESAYKLLNNKEYVQVSILFSALYQEPNIRGC